MLRWTPVAQMDASGIWCSSFSLIVSIRECSMGAPGIHQKMLRWTPVAPSPCPVLKKICLLKFCSVEADIRFSLYAPHRGSRQGRGCARSSMAWRPLRRRTCSRSSMMCAINSLFLQEGRRRWIGFGNQTVGQQSAVQVRSRPPQRRAQQTRPAQFNKPSSRLNYTLRHGRYNLKMTQYVLPVFQ